MLAAIEWKILIDAFAEAKAAIDPDRWIEVRYEDLVRDPIATTKGVTEFMGLQWSKAFEERSDRYSFDVSRAEAFRRDLAPSDVSDIEAVVGSHLEALGYRLLAEGGDTVVTLSGSDGVRDRASEIRSHPRVSRPAGWRRVVVAGLVACLTLLAMGPASATTVSFSGSLDANGTNWRAHTFEVTSPGQITAVLDWVDPAANLNMFLYNAAGTLVASTIGTAKPERIDHNATTIGTWKVGVKAKTGSTTYDLQVDFPGSSSVVAPRYVATLGGGTAGHADMYPSGLDVDGSGNVYVADTGDDQIQKFDASGDLLWVKGTRGPKAPGRFENPRDTAFLAGKVYVADTGFSRVQVLDAADGSVDRSGARRSIRSWGSARAWMGTATL